MSKLTMTSRMSPLAALAGAALLAAFAGAGCKKAGEDQETNESKTDETAANDSTAADTAGAKKGGDDAAGFGDAAGTYEIDPGHSQVVFEAEHFGVSRVAGMLPKVTGTLELAEDPAESSVNLEVDAASLFTGLKKRDDHLKSPDFLNVKQFPTITFASTGVKAAGEGKYEVTGDLTLHGVTKEVTATFEHVGAQASPQDESTFLTGFYGTLPIHRSEFGIDFMVPQLGDEILLTVNVEGARKGK